MIYFLILLDIIINNYSSFTSYFFIIYLYNKPYKYYLLTALIFDLVIFNTLYINIIIFSILYFLNKIFANLNKNNIFTFLFFCLFNYNFYIILSNLLNINGFAHILMNIGTNLLINILFYLLSFRLFKDKMAYK